MLQAIRARREDEGFTLIELMVVVLIIAILIAIAVPTFLGARERAQDRGAQSNLRNTLTAAKTLFADDGDYSGVEDGGDADAIPDISAVEPSLDFQVAATTTMEDISIVVSDTVSTDDTVVATSRADSAVCFFIRDVATTGTQYGSTDPAPAAGCDAAVAPTSGWLDEW